MRRACFCLLLILPTAATAAEPLPARIDALIDAAAKGRPASPPADDGEFLRRVTLDLAGRIPTAAEGRAFLADTAPDKRTKAIDRLLAGPDYPRRMADAFHVMLMERLGDHPGWDAYLQESFAANTPWDRMARDMLKAGTGGAPPGTAFFLAKRLENYGQNPVDYPALTRDVGRLFLGLDLACAQCHDHLFVKDYKQRDFQGLAAFLNNVSLLDAKAPAVAEKPLAGKVSYLSVFRKQPRETAPRLPGGEELTLPVLAKGQEWAVPPDPKAKKPGVPRFSTLQQLAETVPANPAFARNMANRLWWLLMGRGLVHPLDLHHADNPPSHPELLDLLAREFAAGGYDIRAFLRALALTRAYQRSSLLPDGPEPQPESFLTALEKRLSAEQTLDAVLTATGERERVLALPAADKGSRAALLARFQKALAGPVREPELDVAFSLKGALFLRNDETVLGLLQPRPGNLADRLARLADAQQVADELYLSILTRPPTAEEGQAVARHLAAHPDRRPAALNHLAWSLLTSTEFSVNH